MIEARLLDPDVMMAEDVIADDRLAAEFRQEDRSAANALVRSDTYAASVYSIVCLSLFGPCRSRCKRFQLSS